MWSDCECSGRSFTAAAPMFRFGDSFSIGRRLKFRVGGATAGEGIVRVRNLKIRVHTLKHGCLLPSHGRKVRADEIGHQHGLSVRGSVALAGDGQQECSKELKSGLVSSATDPSADTTIGARVQERSSIKLLAG